MRRCVRLWVVCLIWLVSMCGSASAQTVADGIVAGTQEYLLLATISDITDNAITVEPYHSIVRVDDSGQEIDGVLPIGQSIQLEKFRYSYCIEHAADSFNTPRLGDNIFVSLTKRGSSYVVQNGAFKTNTVDYKILTFLVPANMRDQDCMEDLVALSYFVRTDGKVTAFSFDNGSVKVLKDERELLLYPSDKVKDLITFVTDNGKAVDGGKPKDVIMEQAVEREKPFDYRWLVAMGVLTVGLIAGAVVLSILLRRDGRKLSKKSK